MSNLMRRTTRILGILLTAAVLFAGADFWRERSVQHTVDLRDFDGPTVGKLDANVWRSYYERRL
jgi:hypothetical protein